MHVQRQFKHILFLTFKHLLFFCFYLYCYNNLQSFSHTEFSTHKLWYRHFLHNMRIS